MQKKIVSFLLAFAAVALLGSTASAQQKFTVNLNTIQEVPPTNTTGRGRCMVTLNLAQTQITDVTCEYAGLSSGVISGHIHGPAAPGTNVGVLFNLTPPTGATSGTFTRGPFDLTPEQLGFLRSKRLYVNIHTTNFPNGEIRGQIKIQTTPYDNDGDGRTDLKVYRQSTSTFHVLNSINNSIFNSALGFGVDFYVPQSSDDYDGDGRGDLVLTREPGINIVWRILQTGSNTVREVYWGLSGDDFPMPADYDGDGKTDIAVFRASEGIWYILQSSNNQLRAEIWGEPFDFPQIGDFDGDGRNDLTVLRPVGDTIGWFTKRSSDGALNVTVWGTLVADAIFSLDQVDIDGDGIQDRMVLHDPNTGVLGNQVIYYILRSSDNRLFALPFGLDTDDRLTGDYDGDGRTDFVARRNIGGRLIWFIYQSSNGQMKVVNWGITGDASRQEIGTNFPNSYRFKAIE